MPGDKKQTNKQMINTNKQIKARKMTQKAFQLRHFVFNYFGFQVAVSDQQLSSMIHLRHQKAKFV